jgi:hypothetical protein
MIPGRLNILLLSSLLLVFQFAAAQTSHSITRTGYLIDISCGIERSTQEPGLGPKHTKKCLQMPACDRSGFGILVDTTNDLLTFDEDGNRQVRALIAKANRQAGFRITIVGLRDADRIHIKKLKLLEAKRPE